MTDQHPFMQALYAFEETLYDKMSHKKWCDCEIKQVQIVTHTYEYCKECGGIIGVRKTFTEEGD